MNSTITLRGQEHNATRIKLAEKEPAISDDCDSIDQGLRDIARGEYAEIRRTHISEDVDKLFDSFKED